MWIITAAGAGHCRILDGTDPPAERPPLVSPAPPRPVPAGLDASPVAHVGLRADGCVAWANAAAAALLGPEAVATGQDLGQLLGLDRAAPVNEPVHMPTLRRWLRVQRAAAVGGGWTLALTDAQPEVDARAEAVRLAQLLDIAGEAGRLGTWSRDGRSMAGRWDRNALRMWALDPDSAAPPFERATEAIVDDDREPLRTHFLRSLAEPGHHEHRYRVIRPDGSIGSFVSRWRVCADAEGRPNQALGVIMNDTHTWLLAQARDERASELELAEGLMALSRWRHDLRTNHIHYNAHSYDVIGMEPRPDGMPVDEVRALVHPDDLPGVLASAKHTLHTGEPTDFEARYRHVDGSWRVMRTRRALERDAMGDPQDVIGVSRDTTHTRDTTRRSAELAERLDLAARSAGIGIWSQGPDDERAHWNAQMRLLHGLPDGAPVPAFDEWLETHVHAEDRQRVRRAHLRLLTRRRHHVQLEFRLCRADGEMRQVLTHVHVEGQTEPPVLFGIVVDVTERRRADDALRLAGERAALAARGAGIGTFELETAQSQALWDEQMWRLRGREPQTDRPSPELALTMLHPDDRECRGVCPAGRVRWIASRSSSIHEGPGQRWRRIGINWDITEVKQAEAERHEREAAVQANRAKSELLSRVSHELRTPMNAVLGFTQLMLARVAEDDVAARRMQLQQVLVAGEHLLAMINDVLDLAAVESGRLQVRREPVPLAALTQGALELLEPLRQNHGGPQRRVGPLQATPLADPTRLRQVLLNLLSNAIKYNRRGGWIEVSACTEGDAEVRIDVRDGGIGLSDSQRQQLFQPFNRLGQEGQVAEGTGIGLAIAKALVEHMGGRLEVQSEAGVGSCFSVLLPATTGGARHAVPADAPAPVDASVAAARSALRGTVLYIEDNPVNALLVKEMLRGAPGLTLLEAVDGASGLVLAQQHRPDLLLVDMQLPDMDGFEVLRRLRLAPDTAGLRCVALSANAMPEDIERAREAGFEAYWTKPLELASFLSSLQAALAGLDPPAR